MTVDIHIGFDINEWFFGFGFGFGLYPAIGASFGPFYIQIDLG